MRSLEERVRELEDLEAIRRVKLRYARLNDMQDTDAIVEMFTDDAVWDGGMEFGRYEGHEAIRSFFNSAWKDLTWSVNLVTNPEIQIAPSGEEATGSWRLWEPAIISGRAVWMSGLYIDRYRKTNGEWLISYCQIKFDFISPFDFGWARQRFVAGDELEPEAKEEQHGSEGVHRTGVG